MNASVRLSINQISYIVEKTGITDTKRAIEYFAELMMKERIDPTRMPVYVSRMMEKERKAR